MQKRFNISEFKLASIQNYHPLPEDLLRSQVLNEQFLLSNLRLRAKKYSLAVFFAAEYEVAITEFHFFRKEIF